MPSGCGVLQRVCALAVWLGPVTHLTQAIRDQRSFFRSSRVFFLLSELAALLFDFELKTFSWLPFMRLLLALQCSMSSIHTWSTLGWGSRSLAAWSPNGSGSTSFPRSRCGTASLCISLPALLVTRLKHALFGCCCFLTHYRKASSRKRKGMRNRENPGFPASSALSADPAELKAHRVSVTLPLFLRCEWLQQHSTDPLYLFPLPCKQRAKPRTADPGLRSSCPSPPWGPASTSSPAAWEAASRARAPNSRTPPPSTPRRRAAPPITRTAAETQMRVNNGWISLC